MLIHKYILPSLAAALLAMVAATGCVADSYEPEPPTAQEPEQPAAAGNVTLTITAAPLGGVTSRATEHFTDPELTENPAGANELINNWVVAFVNSARTVVAVVDGKPGSGGTSGATGVWNDRVRLELPRGTYTVLAFANVNQDNVKSWLTGPTLEQNWQGLVYNEERFKPLDNSLIPMSGYLENVSVQGTVNEEFAVEVVRMYAKIEYAVKNMSQQRIDIQSFTIGPINTGKIYCFPDYGEKPNPNPGTQYPANPPHIVGGTDGAKYETIIRNAPTNFVFEPNSSVSNNNSNRGNFYVKESIAEGNHPTNHFHIGLKLKRGESTAEDVTYALAHDSLKFIYRNDYILFPIVISDYVPEFEVIDFPPIGGYPVQVAAVNNEFYATFSSSGAFDISARLRDSNGRTVAIQPYDGTNTQDNYVRFVSSVPAMQLTFDPALGTWQGNFIFTQGTNKHIVLTFEFKIGDLIYTRTLHLLSK